MLGQQQRHVVGADPVAEQRAARPGLEAGGGRQVAEPTAALFSETLGPSEHGETFGEPALVVAANGGHAGLAQLSHRALVIPEAIDDVPHR